MTDFDPLHALGEDILKLNDNIAVEYGGTIVAGDFLQVTGVNSDNQLIVEVQTILTNARFIAKFDGVLGDFKQAMIRGQTKITFGSDVTVGASFQVVANEVVNDLGTGPIKGFIISDGAAQFDTGDVYFDGVLGGFS
jgi:hypothetical protein